jgi:hypothetical protein
LLTFYSRISKMKNNNVFIFIFNEYNGFHRVTS